MGRTKTLHPHRAAAMKKHVVILGAGFAGLELAARLSESLADEVRVTLIDQNDSFSFGFSKLDIMFGRKAAADVRLHYRDISKDGVEFRQERVTSIDPETRRVTTDEGSYDADVLAVALGADYDIAATPGFEEGGFEYYSVAGAERMRDVLPDFESGRIVIGILGHPFKCPPAPFEGALLLHDHFAERGVREAAEIRVIGPMAAPVPITKEVSQRFLEALGERGIEYVPNQLVIELDTGGREARLASGGSVPYDLFIGIPVHRVPEVVESSGLAVDGWVPVDHSQPRDPVPGRLRARRRRGCAGRKGGCVRRGRRRGRGRRHRRAPSWRRARAALRGRGQLLHRVRRRDGRKGRGQLPRRAGANGAAAWGPPESSPRRRRRSRRPDESAGSGPDQPSTGGNGQGSSTWCGEYRAGPGLDVSTSLACSDSPQHAQGSSACVRAGKCCVIDLMMLFMSMKRRVRISKGGQISIPAAIRHRWATSTVALEDQGDRIVLEPAPDDPIAAAEGALAEEFGALDVTWLRRKAREDEEVAEARRGR